MKELAAIVSSIERVHLIVLGDFLLDEFIFGEIARTSREAPVLILRYRERDWRPGGGANTVAGVAALGARVTPIGILGADAWGDGIAAAWPSSVSRDHILRSSEFKTTCKSRILAGSVHSFRQQVVRLDYENQHVLSDDAESRLLESLQELAPAADGIIVSDYSIGTVTPRIAAAAIELAQTCDTPLVVDSRFHPERFAGATCITPNITELEEATGEKIGQNISLLGHTGTRLLEEWNLSALLVTRGRQGMSLFWQEKVEHIPAHGSDEVADVTGAGDTVTATYTAALATGAGFKESARLANIAAGIVVGKKGTATVSSDEILAELGDD